MSSTRRAATVPFRPWESPPCQTPQERFEQMFLLRDMDHSTSDGSGLIPPPIIRYSNPKLPQSPGSIHRGPATRKRRRRRRRRLRHPQVAVSPPALHLPIPQYIRTPIPPGFLPPLPPALVCDPPTLYGSNRTPLSPQYPHGLNLAPLPSPVSNHSSGYHTATTLYTMSGSSHVVGSPCSTLTPPLPTHYQLPHMATVAPLHGTWRAPPAARPSCIPIRSLQLRSSSPFVPPPRPCNPLVLPQLQFPSPPLKDIENREQSNRSTASGMVQLHEESELIVISEDDAERSSPNTAATTIPCTTADTVTDAKGLFTFNYIDTDDHYSTTSQASSGIVSTSGFVSMPFTYADTTTDGNPSSVSTKESGVISAASTAKPSAQKPPYSMTALVGMAISSLPNKRASPKEIYSFISSTFPFYSRSQRAWKNSVRHCLQNSKCFKPVEEPSQGYWEIDNESKENFMKGSFQKPLVLKKRNHSVTTTSTRKRSKTVNTAGASLDSIWLKYANELNIKVIPNTNVEILELLPPDSPKKQFFKVFL